MEQKQNTRIFYADVSQLQDYLERPDIWRLLCDARQKKIEKCKKEKDRLRTFGAGLLLEYGLRQFGYTQNSAEYQKRSTVKEYRQVFFSQGEYGKPMMDADSFQDASLCFNLSHAGNYAAAVFGSQPVGVDVECIRTGGQKIANRFFSEDEKRYLCGNWSDDLFTKTWTRKEAYVKAVGKGIAIRLDSFSVLEDKMEKYVLTSWKPEPDMWISVCEKNSAAEIYPEKVDLKAFLV